LFGMGLRSFSMSPAFVPIVKDLVGRLTREKAEAMLRHVLKMRTTAQITRYMDEQIRVISPKLALLDS